MENLTKLIVRLVSAICVGFLLLSTTSCQLEYEESCYKNLQDQVKASNLPDSLKSEIATMTFWEFLRENPLKREIAKLSEAAAKEQAIRDSIIADLIAVKEAELIPVRAEYQDKVEILRIKRIWLNGDLLPWTYKSWLKVSYHFSGSFGRGRVSGDITPDMKGYAKYIGESKLDYINVVFSDNSYKRFLIKDNPKWLLAREGEKVERHYSINKYHVGSDVGKVLEKEPFDLIVNISYVPLLK